MTAFNAENDNYIFSNYNHKLIGSDVISETF